jgi:hypothetical protein
VVLTKLADPLYPPLARQTGITGDVELMLEIRNDGSIQSVDVVKGHPLITIRVPGNSRAKITDELAEDGIEFIHIDSHVCSPY